MKMPRAKLDSAQVIANQISRAKQPTPLYREFAEWIQEVAGVKISPTHLQLGGRLYMEFQKKNRDEGGERSKPVAAAASPKPKAKAKVNEQPADLDEVVEEVAEKPKPKAPARKPAAKPVAKPAQPAMQKPAAKPAAKPRPRGKLAATEEAPY